MRVPRLRIWFSSWVRNLAELRHQQRVQGLLERLTYSVHVPTALEGCPMLQNVSVMQCLGGEWCDTVMLCG